MKKSLIALLVMTVLTSCFSCKSFKINVNLDNSTEKTVYLSRFENGALTTIDSVVAKNNKAVFKMKKSDNNDALHIMINGWRRPLTFFADNQNVTITGDYQKYNEIVVAASESQEKLNKFMAEVDNMEDEKDIYFAVLDFVKQNFDNPVGIYVMYRYKWVLSLSDLENLYVMVPENMQCGYKAEVEKYIEVLKKTQPGQHYIDFKQTDINGNIFVLSEQIQKYEVTILDFWASWCPDCRKVNPELVNIYNQFKDKGLNIVSVSLDTDAERWKKAIADDNLSWPDHVSDLKGWRNEVADTYMIAFIPQNFIIDKNGTILEKNLPIDKMIDLLSNTLR